MLDFILTCAIVIGVVAVVILIIAECIDEHERYEPIRYMKRKQKAEKRNADKPTT